MTNFTPLHLQRRQVRIRRACPWWRKTGPLTRPARSTAHLVPYVIKLAREEALPFKVHQAPTYRQNAIICRNRQAIFAEFESH